MNILETIVARRRLDVDAARRQRPAGQLETDARRRTPRSFMASLAVGLDAPCIIAEIKRASPSAGMIRPDLSPPHLAETYRDNGAAAISILTEPHYFNGLDDDLRQVRAAVDLPLLRKDFIVDPYQVVETAALGADMILLIVAVLDPLELRDLAQAAIDYGLEPLIEVHDEHELDTALAISGALIGVNSRNLKTLVTDLAVARRLSSRIPADRAAVAESGIRSAADIQALWQCGYRGFLIGEQLLKQGDPAGNLRALRNR